MQERRGRRRRAAGGGALTAGGGGDGDGEDARAPCVLPKLFGARCTIDFSHPMRKILRGGAGGGARGAPGGPRGVVGGGGGREGGRRSAAGRCKARVGLGQTVGRRRHCESVTTARTRARRTVTCSAAAAPQPRDQPAAPRRWRPRARAARE